MTVAAIPLRAALYLRVSARASEAQHKVTWVK